MFNFLIRKKNVKHKLLNYVLNTCQAMKKIVKKLEGTQPRFVHGVLKQMAEIFKSLALRQKVHELIYLL